MFERLGMPLRLRDPWEALDLGFSLVRAHGKAVFLAWLAVTVPLTGLLVAIFRDHLWVPPLVVWWLKPLLDRVVLHVLAKATFGEVPRLRDTFRHAPHFLRRGLLATLLWRRLSPHRSFVLPVWQLEEQPGAGYRKRCGLLLRRGRGQAVCLTFVCLLFHLAIFFSVLAAISLLTPLGSDFEVMAAVFGSGSERLRWVDLMLCLLPVAAITLLEPFYVAGGFALYLNRRVELEGWDLEVAFRKLAARAAKVLGRSVAALLLACALFAPSQLQARPEPKAALAEVLQAPEFQVKRKEKGLHWKLQPPSAKPRTRWSLPDLTRLLKLLAASVKWTLILAAGAGLGLFLWRNRRTLLQPLEVNSAAEAPDILMGLNIRPEALPADLDGAAARLWAGGDARAALALLYRGALAHLVHHGRAPLSAGATEGECLRQARALLPPASADYFGRLTLTWLQAAYAGQPPPPGSEALCGEWRVHFGDAAREADR